MPEVTKIFKENTKAHRRNAWVDSCRSTAITFVLLSHGRHFLTPVWPTLNAFNVGGFLGVELFFVISGFLIGDLVRHEYICAQSKNWIVNFWSRRWLRTLPNYYLFLLVNAMLVATGIESGRLADLVPFLCFLQNFAWSHPYVFGEAWSLAVEEVFYVMFPLALLMANRVSANRVSAFLAVSIWLLLMPLIARFVWVIHADPTWDEGVRKVVVFRLDALMVGVFAGWAASYMPKTPNPWRLPIALLAVALIGLSIGSFFSLQLSLNDSTFGRVWLFPLTSVGFGLAILAGLDSAALPPPFRGYIEYFARLSYALYLAHMPVFFLINHFLGRPLPSDAVGAISRWCLFFLGSIVIAMIVEACYERPILKLRDRIFPRP